MAVSALGSAAGTSASIAADYMKLLVAQLQNQNPLEPMDNAEMTSQLAALSQLEQLEGMSNTFEKVLVAQQFSQAGAMIGREVAIPAEEGEGIESGRVLQVDIIDGKPELVVQVQREVVEDGKLSVVPAYRRVAFEEVQSIGAMLATAAAPALQPGDINGDGVVGIADLVALADNYGKGTAPSE
ncbi:MAG TPA: flagellar hook capping FlgD N-terminal domain-containing protein [Phycisphaerae bacterium]|nr:flagellar hook capping FlgD N-terminal domain-containing protein [Phycisphaerae bacterium]